MYITSRSIVYLHDFTHPIWVNAGLININYILREDSSGRPTGNVSRNSLIFMSQAFSSKQNDIQ